MKKIILSILLSTPSFSTHSEPIYLGYDGCKLIKQLLAKSQCFENTEEYLEPYKYLTDFQAVNLLKEFKLKDFKDLQKKDRYFFACVYKFSEENYYMITDLQDAEEILKSIEKKKNEGIFYTVKWYYADIVLNVLKD